MKRRNFIVQFALGILAVACGTKGAGGTYMTGGLPVTAAACSSKNPNIMISTNSLSNNYLYWVAK
ncbi:MAG: hypothetical protein A2X86_20810 [Bdellovibrionales bacterium GWA2_49_15]|nr:MAG: hypothetical protein A2X86_20810 [Bdellovibrionales bacterium GWA2_49_15]HAZ13160.1 hypothetical protein [Bdellovibrionales bacterium]